MGQIARTVAEAQVGDLIWVNPDRWRGLAWELWHVRRVGRVYLSVSASDLDHAWVQLERDRRGDDNRSIAGSLEREVAHYRGLEEEMVKRIHAADLDTLKTVAFVLGLDAAPDFAAPPSQQSGER